MEITINCDRIVLAIAIVCGPTIIVGGGLILFGIVYNIYSFIKEIF